MSLHHRATPGVIVENTIGGYLIYARDQWPTVMGEQTRWGFLEEDPSMIPMAACTIAQLWKQDSQKRRRKCSEEARLQMPHPALPDLTPYQVQILIEELHCEDKQVWCTDEGYDSDDSDDDDNNVPGEI